MNAISLLGMAGTPTVRLGAPPASLAAAPAPPSSLDCYIQRLEKEMATFDVKAARRQTAGVIAAGITVAGVTGQLCKAFLPPGVSFGVAAVLSAGIAAVSCTGVSHAMHALRDPSSLYGVGVLTFFSGFAMAGSVTGNPLVIAGATAAVGVGIGALFARQAETRHFDIPWRIQRARQVADKFHTYQAQHAELEQRSKP